LPAAARRKIRDNGREKREKDDGAERKESNNQKRGGMIVAVENQTKERKNENKKMCKLCIICSFTYTP